MQPLYGFASGDPLRFRRAIGHSDLFYVEDRDLEFKEVLLFCFLYLMVVNYSSFYFTSV